MISRHCCLLLLMFVATAGCGPKALEEQVAADAASAWNEARDAFAEKDFERTAELLDLALSDGGLPPDIYAEALISRAICRARLERFDEALTDLAEAEMGPISLAQVHMTRSFVYKQQGKMEESREEASRAKKIDRRVKTIR